MALILANGDAFATGATRYDYRAATIAETSPRIILTIAVGNYRTAAFVDTGGIYFLCTPPFARRLRLDPAQGLPTLERIRWRGEAFTGLLYPFAADLARYRRRSPDRRSHRLCAAN